MKKLLFVLLVVSLLVLSACGGEKAVKETGQVTEEKKGETPMSLVTDMAKAFMLNVPYKCEYNIEGVNSVSYIKGETRIRTTTTTPQGSNEALVRDDMMYNWNPDTKEGFKLKFDKEIKEGMPEGTKPVGAAALKEQAVNVKCDPAKFSDEMFEVPTDVEFQDMTELMKQAQELAKQFEDMK
ncbi:hypothetical protein KY340_02995 [Candidatus Woesearchaeota archaeon]|nr:hypothetical protein [Candidatus Woesearchaeota archaeon]